MYRTKCIQTVVREILFFGWGLRLSRQRRMNILFWGFSPFRKDPLSSSSGRKSGGIFGSFYPEDVDRCCYPFTKLHDVTFQNNVDFIGCTLYSYKEDVMGGTCNTSGNVNT